MAGTNRISSLGNAIGNEKRVFILKQLTRTKKLTWTQISESLEREFKVKMNPNTVSFHLRYLLESGIVNKAGETYFINENVKDRLKMLIEEGEK